MKKVLLPILLTAYCVLFTVRAVALECGEPIPEGTPEGVLKTYIDSCNQKIATSKGAQATLSSAINYLSAQIGLTQAKIASSQTQLADLERQIGDLSGKISTIDYSLDDLTRLFVSRVRASYKSRDNYSLAVLSQATGLADLLKNRRYVEQIRDRDHALLLSLEKSRLDFNTQKAQKEQKQNEIEQVKASLDREKQSLATQKATKDKLLADTKNDEKRYQSLLSNARAEYEAIVSIISGNGVEIMIGPVSEGQRIASVIQGSSCNSGGTHLHFIVKEGDESRNPFSYLTPIDHENCSGSSCGSSDGDPFNPSGSWPWPISPTIKFSQGYGSTWATQNTWVGKVYNFHNGIDINGSNPEVRAVKSGTLYRGSYTGLNGCALRYVRVDHSDSSLDTLYLHINY